MNRRQFLKGSAAGLALPLFGCAGVASKGAGPRVVVVGGGFGGATAARYLRLWDPGVDVVLVERNARFVSCPLSNLVLGGSRSIEQLTFSYEGLERKHGVRVVQDEVLAIDAARRQVRLQSGEIGYDRLILSPGIDFLYDQIPSLDNVQAREQIPHAWKAGPQTVALRRQLETIPDGGVYVIGIPLAPYRCPPGPYERASQVAHYFKQAKPRSKVIVLDANPDITSKKGLFTKVWSERYPGIVEYRPNSKVIEVDVAARTARTEFERVRADVLNIVPPQRAGNLARDAGLLTVDRRWAGVDYLTYESNAVPGIHVVGDAISAPPTPKSGHMANQQAKIAAAAVLALLRGEPVNPDPVFANTCYSYVSDKDAAHVAAVYRYDKAKQALYTVNGTFGVSERASEQEGEFANAWARNIWNDALAT
ncbi:MAG: FCSD flavin-binding domain-containing protein [Betaproteobacteria bacterium]|nr:FCSD flavin-binding domain-containing protein [Betaproteobacteria bacterium]